jgi:hypothetical protein
MRAQIIFNWKQFINTGCEINKKIIFVTRLLVMGQEGEI